ncbi:MAG: DUF1192 domain-containing protein [Hyphomicrobium sp.]
MDWDEAQKTPQRTTTLGENLETLSIGELERRIAELRGEIARVETELARKRAHEAAASALFKR